MINSNLCGSPPLAKCSSKAPPDVKPSLIWKRPSFLATLSMKFPGEISMDSPSRQNLFSASASANMQCPPLTKSVKKGNFMAGSKRRGIRACASMWCMGMNGSLYLWSKSLVNWMPSHRQGSRPDKKIFMGHRNYFFLGVKNCINWYQYYFLCAYNTFCECPLIFFCANSFILV